MLSLSIWRLPFRATFQGGSSALGPEDARFRAITGHPTDTSHAAVIDLRTLYGIFTSRLTDFLIILQRLELLRYSTQELILT
jgi:hypothetical protein